jgi:hypothetical protein
MSRFSRVFFTLFLLAPAGLPFAIANLRRHHQRWAILMLNLIAFGLFLACAAADGTEFAELGGLGALVGIVGWLAALVWSCTAVTRELTAAEIGPAAVASALNV